MQTNYQGNYKTNGFHCKVYKVIILLGGDWKLKITKEITKQMGFTTKFIRSLYF